MTGTNPSQRAGAGARASRGVPPARKRAVAIAAAAITVVSALAAVGFNLNRTASTSSPAADQAAATAQPAATAPPSTIYVDVTVPDLPADAATAKPADQPVVGVTAPVRSGGEREHGSSEEAGEDD